MSVESTWASDVKSPQVLRVAWEYSSPVRVQIPSKFGFGNGGGEFNLDTQGVRKNKTISVDGRCWGEFGTPNQTTRPIAKTDLNSNTGTGANTNFSLSDKDQNAARNLVLNFVRGTAE